MTPHHPSFKFTPPEAPDEWWTEQDWNPDPHQNTKRFLGKPLYHRPHIQPFPTWDEFIVLVAAGLFTIAMIFLS